MATKYVKCVDPSGTTLREGETYEVVSENIEYYFFKKYGPGYWKSRFEVVESHVTAKDTQIGGNHYSKLAIQPYEYITSNGIGMIEGNVIKYVTRWKDKNGVEDLKKAVHSLQWLIEYTEKNDAE